MFFFCELRQSGSNPLVDCTITEIWYRSEHVRFEQLPLGADGIQFSRLTPKALKVRTIKVLAPATPRRG